MLIHPGFWAASKGMVLVPNIVGQTTTNATTAIIAAGLLNSGNSTTSTSNAGLNGQVASQDPAALTKVSYQSNVSYISYVYTAPPPPPPVLTVPDVPLDPGPAAPGPPPPFPPAAGDPGVDSVPPPPPPA
jgi:serine/threonine-protein kinase